MAFKWYKGLKSNREASTIVVPDGNVAIAKFPDGKVVMYIGDGAKQMKDLGQLAHIYPYSDVVTNTIGAVNAGDSLLNLDTVDIIKRLVSPYQVVVLNSISVNPNKFEIGQTLSGNITVVCTAVNLNNINPGASTVESSNPSIFTKQAIDPNFPKVLPVTSHQKTAPSSITITVKLIGLNGEVSTKTASISWFSPIVYGATNDLLIDTQTKFNTLMGINKILQSSRQGYYNFNGGYSHIFIPKTMSISGIGFTDIDLVTGNPLFTYDVTQQTDKTFSNGYINVDFYYFRSTYLINAPTKMQII